ncbi:MAG: magnesium transporter [Bacilli bacterium]|nr:magnesium transporter [Bacilli bacterium]
MFERIKKLIEEKNYSKIKKLLIEMNEFDIAEILNDLPPKEIIKIFRLLPKDIGADVFSYLESDTATLIISSLSDSEAVDIINDMYADDAADLFEEMPANVVKKLLNKVDSETRKNINQLLKYPENSAGSLMTVEYIDFKEYITIKDAIKKIKREYEDAETINTCFVTDKKKKLIGVVKLKDLIINDEDTPVNEIMNEDFMYVTTLTDQEEVAKTFQDYDLTSMPVVDSEDKLVGIITIDDVIDIIEEETTEDIERMAGITPTEKSYLKLSTFDLFKSRIPWLFVLMISATLTGKIIERYETALSSYIILTAFIPMLMNTGGNAGGQSSATIIRALSLGDIEYKDTLKVIFKEFRTAILAGIALAIVNFGKLMLFDKVGFNIALVISLSLFVTVCAAKSIGSFLPIIAKKLGFDPTVMAGPFITTLVDAISLFVYFTIATSILGL